MFILILKTETMKKLFTFLAIIGIATLNVNGQAWFENFESGTLPTGWTIETSATDGGWLFGANLGSGSFSIPKHTIYAATNDDACNCNKANDNLITNIFNIPESGTTVLSFAYYFEDGDFEGDETAKVLISTNGGASWIELMNLSGVEDWTFENILLTDYAGQNVKLSFKYDDGGSWNYGFAVDDISIGPDDYNFTATVIVPEIYTTEDGDITVSANFLNYGLEEVTSFTFNYQVDGGDVVSSEITGLTMGTFDMELVVHPVPFAASELGDIVITAWASDVNGQEGINSNNTMGGMQITNQHSTKTGLSETFTSNTCPPCAGFNPPYQTQLDALNTNISGSNYVAIKYQVNWPSPGNDVCYNSDIQTRVDYYGVTGVPNTIVESINANYNYSYTAETWDDAADNTSLQWQDLTANHGWVSITTNAIWNDSYHAYVEVEITPNANFDANSQTLYVAVINNYYTDTEISPNGTNGETDWSYVVRKMLPNGGGTSLGALTTGSPVTFNFEYQFEIGNVLAGGYNLVNEDISVVAWVQDNDSRLVRNASLADITTDIDEISTISDFKIYPNPTDNVAHIAMNLIESNAVTIEVVNLLGKVVYSEEMGNLPAGKHLIDVDAASIGTGLYLFNIYIGGQKVTERVSISK